jgi:hypothetical protein
MYNDIYKNIISTDLTMYCRSTKTAIKRKNNTYTFQDEYMLKCVTLIKFNIVI